MARHDPWTQRDERLVDDDADLPTAPEPTWLRPEPAEDAFADSWRVPSYDLGPDTESVVVDLPRLGGAPSVSPLEAVGPTVDPVTTPAGDESGDDKGSDKGITDPLDQAVETPRSRHAAPVTAPFAVVERVHEREMPSFDIPPAPDSVGTGAETLTAANVLRSRRARPQSGWRKAVLTLTAGKVNLGLSPADRYQADLLAKARTPVRGTHRVAIISLKGGVGKTTTTAALGSVFANLRGDRVIAVDANPDRGTLAERVPRESGATIRHLLQSRDQVTRYGDIRAFTSQSPTRLEVLASDSDPGASSALSEQDYIDTVETLERFYNLVLTDCGTGLLHDAMRGVLGLANSLVVVSSASLDGARSASATLDWLEAHGLGDLAKDAVVVISSVRPGGGIVDVMQLEDHFANRCRAVVTIPYDPHLEAGGILELDELDEETMEAYRELAAAVGEGFATP